MQSFDKTLPDFQQSLGNSVTIPCSELAKLKAELASAHADIERETAEWNAEVAAHEVARRKLVEAQAELAATQHKLKSAEDDIRNEHEERADTARVLQAVIDTLAAAGVTGSAESMAKQVVDHLAAAEKDAARAVTKHQVASAYGLCPSELPIMQRYEWMAKHISAAIAAGKVE